MLLDCDWFILALVVRIPPDLLLAWFLHHITWHSCYLDMVEQCVDLSVTRSKVSDYRHGGGHLLNPWGPSLESHIASSIHLLYTLLLIRLIIPVTWYILNVLVILIQYMIHSVTQQW